MKTREITLEDRKKSVNAAAHSDAPLPRVSETSPFEEIKKPKFSPLYTAPKADEPEIAQPSELQVDQGELEEDELPQAYTSPDLGPEWVRQELPSHCVPYSFREVFMRPLQWASLGKIFAAKQNASFSLLVDAMDMCINVDVRELTPSDFTFLMYWVRDNTYPKSPLTLTYKTRYGNEEQISTRDAMRDIVELDMKRGAYRKWKEKGICFPTVRDMELIHGNEVSEDLRYRLNYAQYVAYVPENGDYSDYVEKKLALLDTLGIEAMATIDEFAKLIGHGVNEIVKVTDPSFDPEAAATHFEETAKDIVATIGMLKTEDEDIMGETAMQSLRIANNMMLEAKEIREQLAAGIKVLAKEETVAISITATDFFPSV